VLGAHGIKNPLVLNKALKQYQTDQAFMMNIQQAQQALQRRMMSLGLI